MSREQVSPPEAAGGGEGFITVARIRRPQGRRGEVAAELLTDFPERFRQTTEVLLRDAGGERHPVSVEAAWLHKGGIVLKFAGVDDISAAGQLAGCEVQVPAAARWKIEGRAVYISDLPGCRVVERGKELGAVRYLDTSVGTPVLVVETPEGELLIPFAEEICRRVDPAAGVIEVELPEGLRDLNR